MNFKTALFGILVYGQIGWGQLPTSLQVPEPPGPFCPVTQEQLKTVVSYDLQQPVVGTHFFYWYDADSKAHIVDYDGSDALTDHPQRLRGYSYKSSAWWKRELLDVMAAKIDFILPVYWGCPGDYQAWSFAGLPPLVDAWEQLVQEGKKPPKVGLFYDTSTLRHNPRRWHIDLASAAGKQWFYTTIRDFYSYIPPKMWAAVEGRPIVVLYSPAFAAKQDPALFPWVRARFQHDFSTDMFLVKHVGWQGPADRVCSWGGALGLKAESVAALGPGYDHSAVPNRQPLVVDREDGKFYARQWQRLLTFNKQRRANIVLVETWNELHEGTDVCASMEYGRQYIEMTARFAALFHDGVVLPKTGPFAKTSQVVWHAGRELNRQGIRLVVGGDGLAEGVTMGDVKCWRTKASVHASKYLYYDLDDSFAFDEAGSAVRITIEYFDKGFGTLRIEYDSNDPAGSVREGAFKAAGTPIQCQNTGAWRTLTRAVGDGRFANRTNNADFRLAVEQGDLAVRQVTVTRQPR